MDSAVPQLGTVSSGNLSELSLPSSLCPSVPEVWHGLGGENGQRPRSLPGLDVFLERWYCVVEVSWGLRLISAVLCGLSSPLPLPAPNPGKLPLFFYFFLCVLHTAMRFLEHLSFLHTDSCMPFPDSFGAIPPFLSGLAWFPPPCSSAQMTFSVSKGLSLGNPSPTWILSSFVQTDHLCLLIY